MRQRQRWRKALRIARVLFEDDGYPTTALDEIEAFITRADALQHGTQAPTLDADTEACDTRLGDSEGAPRGRAPALPDPHVAEPPAHVAGQYRLDHYPHSRFWGVYDGERLIAVTVYRRGAREVVGRLDSHERTIAALKRQLGQLPALG